MPTAVSVPARRERAIESGVYFRSRMACWTRARVSTATRGSSLSTRDAVRRLTPATAATSRRMLLVTTTPWVVPSMARFSLPPLCHRWQDCQEGSASRTARASTSGGRVASSARWGTSGGTHRRRQSCEVGGLIGELGRVPGGIALSEPAQHFGGLEAQPDEQRRAACSHQPVASGSPGSRVGALGGERGDQHHRHACREVVDGEVEDHPVARLPGQAGQPRVVEIVDSDQPLHDTHQGTGGDILADDRRAQLACDEVRQGALAGCRRTGQQHRRKDAHAPTPLTTWWCPARIFSPGIAHDVRVTSETGRTVRLRSRRAGDPAA